ncbi:ATP-binding domain-containing protein [Cyanobacterium aponinum UTEX 3222]|uniref:AAA family ATPase n=1 Tax=Cyanobacterium aponinum 0216 TaxID=2676140 RepID=A0A844GT88_9CHRO|nr:ATP-binding domain-containing protein [Cyanobacterium aponinum]MTF38119.1 AAA family ATPase [Cyanobacterium aponinum 0216]WRL42332.1 ATP-binding domain-containing protein [Cyanobacterium aponinum UTEX 3222]
MVDIIRGKSNKPISSEKLANYFEDRSDIEGRLYIGYPIIGTSEGGFPIDALLVSKQHGIIIFHIVEGINHDIDVEEIQDDCYTKMESKLKLHKDLNERRNLVVKISVVTYAPAWEKKKENISEDYPILINQNDLQIFIDETEKWTKNNYFNILNSVIEDITTIRKSHSRNYIKKEDSRGAKLKHLEDSIANLDRDQSRAVIETVEGVQRIRGLAGSGKTIVLALKVAYLHATNPDLDIAVTFYTRSLKDQFKDLINRFTFEKTNREPNWEKVKVIHSWGSPKENGIYYQFCQKHNVEYLDFNSAKAITYSHENEFEVVCQKALNQVNNFQEYYDVILIDEAQDLSEYFIRLCYSILKKPKRLVYAYDELQNLNEKSMKSPEILFGSDIHGNPQVKLENVKGKPQQDIILDTCYRNSRPILTSAHALGFGIYREQGLISMFDQKELWFEIGYENISNEGLEEGKNVYLARTEKTSPSFLESHSPIEDLIQFKTFNNNQEQIEWLVSQIKTNLEEDELKCSDIMVIHPEATTLRNKVGKARDLLFQQRINSNIAGVTSSRDTFFQNDAIIFTSIFRAKGNEAAMIYLINAQECFAGNQLVKKRNILFTAMTRSKAWLRVIGYGSDMKSLEQEFDRIKEHNFILNFKYPTASQREQLKLVNRDISSPKQRTVIKLERDLKSIIDSAEKGDINKDELPPQLKELIEKFKNVF